MIFNPRYTYKQILTIPIDAEPGDLPHLQSAAGTPFGTEENIENLEQLWIWSAGRYDGCTYVRVCIGSWVHRLGVLYMLWNHPQITSTEF